MSRRKRRIAIAAAVFGVTGLAVAAIGVLRVGSALVAPASRSVGSPPPHLGLEVVELVGEHGNSIGGWYRPGKKQGAVLLLHGVRSDRRSMLGRVEFLSEAGYAVLLIDMQAHGESVGTRITFGLRESVGVFEAISFLRDETGGPVAVIGQSLGGAACLLGDRPVPADALVLEGVYADISDAVRNRLRIRFGAPGAWLSPLLTAQLRPRLGVSVSQLQPARAIANFEAPVLIIAGETDQRTTVADTRRLYDAATAPKALWIVSGAPHVDLHEYDQANYESRVLAFLQEHIGRAGWPASHHDDAGVDGQQGFLR